VLNKHFDFDLTTPFLTLTLMLDLFGNFSKLAIFLSTTLLMLWDFFFCLFVSLCYHDSLIVHIKINLQSIFPNHFCPNIKFL